MNLETIIQRYNASEYPEAVTRAERFVDDITFLRMSRLRMPLGKPEIGGITSESIKAIHLADAAREDWNTDRTNVAFRFPDGSIAYRLLSGRWEAWRDWNARS